MKRLLNRWGPPGPFLLLALVIALFVGAQGCECPSGGAAAANEPPPELWLTVESSNRGPGPRTYITRQPLTLYGGSQVACVSTANGIWCKELGTPETNPSTVCEQVPVGVSRVGENPVTRPPETLDFGGGSG